MSKERDKPYAVLKVWRLREECHGSQQDMLGGRGAPPIGACAVLRSHMYFRFHIMASLSAWEQGGGLRGKAQGWR